MIYNLCHKLWLRRLEDLNLNKWCNLFVHLQFYFYFFNSVGIRLEQSNNGVFEYSKHIELLNANHVENQCKEMLKSNKKSNSEYGKFISMGCSEVDQFKLGLELGKVNQ